MACDPYLETDCQFDQGDYHCYITYLVDPATWAKNEEDSDDIYELEDEDFLSLDEDKGFHLGLPPSLYDILFPRERPFGFHLGLPLGIYDILFLRERPFGFPRKN